MKTKNFLAIVLIAITCLLSCEPVVERAREEFEGRNLSGTWYVNGDPNQRAEIVSTRGGLEARNEKGDTSRLIVERGGDIRAEDWGGRASRRRQSRSNHVGEPLYMDARTVSPLVAITPIALDRTPLRDRDSSAPARSAWRCRRVPLARDFCASRRR